MTLGLDAPPRYGIARAWAMPNSDTFSVAPIADFLRRWHRPPSVDPFARNSEWATYRNDLSPATTAEYHLEAADFCALLAARGVRAEMVLFDPPYSPRQISEVYQSIGRAATTADTQSPRLYREVRDGLDRLLVPGGVALSFGWNSAGFGVERGYEVLEILLVAHGGAHNDTICVAEVKGSAALPAHNQRAILAGFSSQEVGVPVAERVVDGVLVGHDSEIVA